jgi:hypothetical protein
MPRYEVKLYVQFDAEESEAADARYDVVGTITNLIEHAINGGAFDVAELVTIGEDEWSLEEVVE